MLQNQNKMNKQANKTPEPNMGFVLCYSTTPGHGACTGRSMDDRPSDTPLEKMMFPFVIANVQLDRI